MKVQFMPEAENVLFEIGVWVEKRNTNDSGYRYIDKFISKIEAYALPSATYSICKNVQLASYGL